MAVHIRLQRRGATHRPFYHLVAADHRSPRDGRFIEKLGTYDPNLEPSGIVIKAERLAHWYAKGAQLSNAVANLVKLQKLELVRTKTATVAPVGAKPKASATKAVPKPVPAAKPAAAKTAAKPTAAKPTAAKPTAAKSARTSKVPAKKAKVVAKKTKK